MSSQGLRVGCREGPWREMEGPVKGVVGARKVRPSGPCFSRLAISPVLGQRTVSREVVAADFLPS